MSATADERIEKALDTLAELCEPMTFSDENENYRVEEDRRSRRMAAEEILTHYRDQATVEAFKRIEITINGAVPVRPMVRGEVSA